MPLWEFEIISPHYPPVCNDGRVNRFILRVTQLWWTREHVVRMASQTNCTNERVDDDLVLAHARNIKRECLGSERTSRNSEITTVAAFQPDLLPTFARIARRCEKEKGSNARAWSAIARVRRGNIPCVSCPIKGISFLLNIVSHNSNSCSRNCSRNKWKEECNCSSLVF